MTQSRPTLRVLTSTQPLWVWTQEWLWSSITTTDWHQMTWWHWTELKVTETERPSLASQSQNLTLSTRFWTQTWTLTPLWWRHLVRHHLLVVAELLSELTTDLMRQSMSVLEWCRLELHWSERQTEQHRQLDCLSWTLTSLLVKRRDSTKTIVTSSTNRFPSTWWRLITMTNRCRSRTFWTSVSIVTGSTCRTRRVSRPLLECRQSAREFLRSLTFREPTTQQFVT